MWLKRLINDIWRECCNCWKFKLWENYHKSKQHKTGHSPECTDCCKISDHKTNVEKREYYNEKYKNTLSDDDLRKRNELDEIYNNDPHIINNKKILDWIVLTNPCEDKFIYFSNHWYNRKILSKIYWVKEHFYKEGID